jgi:hypothetical protein
MRLAISPGAGHRKSTTKYNRAGYFQDTEDSHALSVLKMPFDMNIAIPTQGYLPFLADKTP